MKKGYWMAMVDVTDAANYPSYTAANKAAFEKYGAKFLVRGGQSSSPEGFATNRHVIVEFNDYETALACYHSPEYQAAAKLRKAYATSLIAIVEGAQGRSS